MISYDLIRKGIRAVLLSVSNPNMPAGSNLAWENHEFKPNDQTPWIRETLLPGNERQSASDTIQSVGVMQYDVFWPAGKGTEEVENLADAIKAAFKPVTVIGSHALVYRADRMPAQQDEKWYWISIRLTWRAHSIGVSTTLLDEFAADLLDEDAGLILEN